MYGSNGANVGILVVSHGDLSKHFLEAARLIYQDDLEGIQALAVRSTSDREEVMKMVHASLAKFPKNTNKIVALCDTHGSTPSRLICDHEYADIELRCVFGLNLSMLLDCINFRMDCGDLEELSEKICKTGKEAIYSKNAGSNGSEKDR